MNRNRKAVLQPFLDKQDYMENRIRQGIDSSRKAWCRIRLEDAAHNAIPGATVRIAQKSSDFKFGANLFMLGEFPREELNAKYERRFSGLLNMATLPFYWRDTEPEQGKLRCRKGDAQIYRRPPVELCLEFCETHGIEPKAHCLNYACHAPDWLPADTATEKRLLEKRFRELSERFACRIPEWEVTNETFYEWNRFRGRSEFFQDPDYVEWSFKTAERFFPANRLFINEMQERIWDNRSFYGNRSSYYMQIERALRNGARIDGIGMQFHMFHRREQEAEKTAEYYDPERIYNVLDCYAGFGKPLQITESTIPAYSENAEDEEIQAEILRNLFRIWFSHPAVEGAVYWNLADGTAAGAAGDMTSGENYYYGGLLRRDLSPKPAYDMLRELITGEWRTSLEAETDGNGELRFHGFSGGYELTVNGCRREFRVERMQSSAVILVIDK